MKRFSYVIVWTLVFILIGTISVKLSDGQVKLSLKQQLQNESFLLAAEKKDTRGLILEIAGLEKTRDQLNNKLIRTQNILKGLVKDEKIKIKDLAPLTSLGYNFGTGAELPSSLPDSVSTKDPDNIRKK